MSGEGNPEKVKRPDPRIAEQALKEAQERRTQSNLTKVDEQRELGGRGGEDPARYGDWEIKGIACDF